MRPIDRLIKKAGSQAAIVRVLGVQNQVVNNWYRRQPGVIPEAWCEQLEAAFGIPRAVLNPKVFGPATKKRAA